LDNPWKNRRILVVDGDDQFRFWARGLFKQQKVAEVVSLPGLLDAKPAIAAHAMDIALLELGHDDGHLLPFLHWLRDAHKSPRPQLPVILLAKSLDRGRLREACALGVHGVVQKPVSGELLLKAVGSVCRNPRRIQLAEEAPAKAPPPVPEAVEPPGSVAHPHHDPEPSAPRIAQPRRASSFVPSEAASVALGGGGGDVALAGGMARAKGAEFLEALETPPAAAKSQGFYGEEAEPAPAAQEDAWDEALGPAPKKKKRRADEEEGFEPPPLPNDGKPVQGRDLDTVLAEHNLWVESKGALGKRADLEGEDLSGRNLAEAALTNANLKRSDLSGSDLSDALLHGADLRHAEIIGGQMQGANLAVARLRHAHLRGCQLQGANFKGADLAGADLSGSIFDGAEMKGANLLGVNLEDADLSGAKGLVQSQLEGVKGNAKTRLPPGLRLPV